MKTLGLCSDHAGYELKEFVKQILNSKGLTYKDFGTCSTESCDYPDYAHPLAEAVEAGEVYPGTPRSKAVDISAGLTKSLCEIKN